MSSHFPLHDDEDDKIEENQEWITTFADMSMLLLVFFILLFSLSTLDPAKFQNSFGSIKGALGGDAKGTPAADRKVEDGALHEMVRQRKEMMEAQTNTFNDIRSFLVQNGVEGKIGAVLDQGTIILRLPAQLLFDRHSTQLSPESEKVLKVLKDIFVKERSQNVDIRGYTDNTPPPEGARFKDNWELSALRAVTVLRYLLGQGIEAPRLTATGFGDLEPIMANTTEENKARNRRVEFVLHRTVDQGKP